jgi:hypothetical protein
MTNLKGPAIIVAYKKAHKFLESRGVKPLLQRLDNESSQTLQSFSAKSNIEFQLAPPPHVHCCNIAEQTIMRFNNLFIAGLCSTTTTFPLNL